MTALISLDLSSRETLLYFTFCPTILGICRKTHGGVKFVWGKTIKEIRPGLYVWWPPTTEIEVVPVARQTLTWEAQRLTTKDDQVITIKVVVVFTLEDVKKALVDTADYDDTAEDIAGEAIADIVAGNTYEHLRKNQREIENTMARKTRTILKTYGLYVERCRIVDFAKTRMFSIDGPPMILPVEASEDG